MKRASEYIQKYVFLPRPELHVKMAAKKAAENILGTEIPLENIRVRNGSVKLTLSSVARTELFLHKAEFDSLFHSELYEIKNTRQGAVRYDGRNDTD